MLTPPEGDVETQAHSSGRRARTVDSWRGWVVVAATVLSTFTLFGVTYSFSTFFNAMAKDFHASKGATAGLFGLTIFFLFTLSWPAGRAADRWGPKPVVALSAVALGGGLLLTANVHTLWVGYITYGLGMGVATACGYVPMVAQVSGWFDRFRPSALGVAVAGIGAGTLFGPKLAAHLIADHGWRSTYRWFAVIGTGILLVSALLAERPPISVTAAGERPALATLVASPVFRRLYIAGLLMGLALFVPFVFLVPFAEDHHVAASTAATLVSFLGAGSILGRVVLGPVGGRMGVVRLYEVCFIGMTASYVLWIVARNSFASMAAFAFVLGLAYGGYVALSPAVIAHLYGVTGLGAVLGALYTSSGIGGLIGPSGAGWVIDHAGSYPVAITLSMAIAAAGCVVLHGAVRSTKAVVLAPTPLRTS